MILHTKRTRACQNNLNVYACLGVGKAGLNGFGWGQLSHLTSWLFKVNVAMGVKTIQTPLTISFVSGITNETY